MMMHPLLQLPQAWIPYSKGAGGRLLFFEILGALTDTPGWG